MANKKVEVTTNMTGTPFSRIEDVPHGTPYDEVFKMLERRLDKLEEALLWEEELRKANPALQDLYEQYQATKRLLGK
jgi:hypothetical protein